jgi:hypothetical protein
MRKILVTCLLVAACCGVAQADATFFDGTFNDADWSTTKLTDTTPPGDATASPTQTFTDGVSAPSRQVTHNWQTSNSGVSILFAHVNTAFAYDPATGPIDSFTISFDMTLPSSINHVSTTGYGPVIAQDGMFYFNGQSVAPIAPEPWTNYLFPTISAAAWSKFGGSGNPDFSKNGSPIQFGYYTSNGGSGRTIRINAVSRLDNFSVEIIPEPTSLALVGLASMAMPRRRSTGMYVIRG